MDRPLILISNDDGVGSVGIRELISVASALGDVVCVAPMQQCSGQSSAITVSAPLRVVPQPDIEDAKVYAVNGTPVDCVKIAMNTLVRRKPDLMLSGINHGSNAGCNCIYSGTMGAAMEACMLGIPAVAFSLLSHNPAADFSGVRPFVDAITRKVLAHGLPEQICLNVNMPKDCTPEGVKVCRAASGFWTDEYKQYTDPSGRPFFMLAGRFVNTSPDDPTTDEYWLARNYISIVPTRPDQSATVECIKTMFE